jgi:hypothetical protein
MMKPGLSIHNALMIPQRLEAVFPPSQETRRANPLVKPAEQWVPEKFVPALSRI